MSQKLKGYEYIAYYIWPEEKMNKYIPCWTCLRSSRYMSINCLLYNLNEYKVVYSIRYSLKAQGIYMYTAYYHYIYIYMPPKLTEVDQQLQGG